jgi:signal transduction histidine kinase
MIERQIVHMVRLVDDLLDVSRLTRGTIELRTQPVWLAEAVEQAAEMIRPAAQARGLALLIGPFSPDLVVEGDLPRLAQVFANLLANGAKFSEPGGSITVSTRKETDVVVVSVKDTGAGISPDLLPDIFELFVQGESSLDRPKGGLGIGLTIVRSILLLHGGSIAAHSEGSGRGSEFVVRLPLTASISPKVTTSEAQMLQWNQPQVCVFW